MSLNCCALVALVTPMNVSFTSSGSFRDPKNPGTVKNSYARARARDKCLRIRPSRVKKAASSHILAPAERNDVCDLLLSALLDTGPTHPGQHAVSE